MTQLQMIDKTKYIAQQDENVSAVFMYGSFTKNEGDKYSDIEFYIFVKNKENFSAEKWVNQIHPVALYFINEYGTEVAIFENFTNPLVVRSPRSGGTRSGCNPRERCGERSGADFATTEKVFAKGGLN